MRPCAATPKPACYSPCEALAMLRCSHCTPAEATAKLACVRTFGPRKVALNGDDVRRIVHEAHGNNSASWLACKVGISLPEWFSNLWLPTGDIKQKVQLISDVWTALEKVAASGGPVLSDDVAAFVRRCGEEKRIGSSQLYYSAADLPSTPPTKRKGAALSVTNGNLRDALGARAGGSFLCGAVQRALRLRGHQWVPSTLLAACADFVTMGECFQGEGWLFDRLHAMQAEAAFEMAEEHAVPVDLLDADDPDAMFDIIVPFVERRRTSECFEALGMEVLFFDAGDYYNIEEVTDIATRTCGCDLGLTSGVELWSSGRNGRHVATLDAEDMRGCFDRHAALTRALASRGLELRKDSRVCNEYIMDGTYSGPSFKCCGDDDIQRDDAMDCAVELMAEMEFLFGANSRFDQFTSELRFAGYDRDAASELAKLAFVHWHVVEQRQPASGLPTRLRAIYEGRYKVAMPPTDAWEKAQAAGLEMREEEERRWDAYSSGHDSDLSDEGR